MESDKFSDTIEAVFFINYLIINIMCVDNQMCKAIRR